MRKLKDKQHEHFCCIVLKGKSRVGIIFDYARDYTVVNGVLYFSSIYHFSLDLRSYVFQFGKKCEMTSFSMLSLHLDMNEAAKCVDIYHSHC